MSHSFATLVAALLAALLAACAPVAPRPEGFAFALLGDIPYSQPHANLLDGLIDEMNADRLGFVVHLGDITSGKGPCTDEWLEARRRQFERLRHPFVLVFGDNEWTDCHRSGFDPLERLARLRLLFHSRDPDLPRFARQSREFPEHARWVAAETLFVTLNVPGSNNNLGGTAAMDAEHAGRMRMVSAWLAEAFALAERDGLSAVAVLLQANPNFELKPVRGRDGYAGLRASLERHALAFAGAVLVAHGDTHTYRSDMPLPNLQRLEVYGWPDARWVKVRPGRGPAARFVAEPGF